MSEIHDSLDDHELLKFTEDINKTEKGKVRINRKMLYFDKKGNLLNHFI